MFNYFLEMCSFILVGAGLTAAFLFVTTLCFNLIKERKAVFFGESHFYDLNQIRYSLFSIGASVTDESEEEYNQLIDKLNTYIVEKKEGLQPVLDEEIRERFIPITFKSVIAFTVFEVCDNAIIIALAGIMYAFAKLAILLL